MSAIVHGKEIIMNAKAKELLTNEDINNRLLGAFVAWSDGWGTIDIFEALEPKVKERRWTDGVKKTYQTGSFRLVIDQASNYYAKFSIGHNKKLLMQTTAQSKGDIKKRMKTFQHYFIEYVLADI